jgi:hypothetical protein
MRLKIRCDGYCANFFFLGGQLNRLRNTQILVLRPRICPTDPSLALSPTGGPRYRKRPHRSPSLSSLARPRHQRRMHAERRAETRPCAASQGAGSTEKTLPSGAPSSSRVAQEWRAASSHPRVRIGREGRRGLAWCRRSNGVGSGSRCPWPCVEAWLLLLPACDRLAFCQATFSSKAGWFCSHTHRASAWREWYSTGLSCGKKSFAYVLNSTCFCTRMVHNSILKKVLPRFRRNWWSYSTHYVECCFRDRVMPYSTW